MRLSQLAVRQSGIIRQVHHHVNGTAIQSPQLPTQSSAVPSAEQDSIATRLNSLGFVSGEQVEVIARGLFGGEPILVKVGVSRFALRHNEAARIEIAV